MRTLMEKPHPSADLAHLLSGACGHVPLSMSALPHARLLWINARAAAHDPQFGRFDGDWHAYSQHVLAQCAFALPMNAELAGAKVTAYADRYGGVGIGSNGGSGRAAYVNGYYVKGIGATPLVGKKSDRVHATGHCELQECIREAVLSECIDAEFPWGAVPVLAIIGTGVYENRIVEAGLDVGQHKTQTMGSEQTELCLLVRPTFLRPAHFDRAANFLSNLPKQGYQDVLRVRAMGQACKKAWGVAEFKRVLKQLHVRWAEQLAYGYVHRFCHGAPSPSNVALDGRLLDFGATSTLPSWARAHTVFGGPATGQELPVMIKALQSMLKQLAHQCPDLGIQAVDMQAMAQAAAQQYAQSMPVELMRVLGLTRTQAHQAMACDDDSTIRKGLNRLLMHYAVEYFNTFEVTPKPRIAWQLADFWTGGLDTVAPGLRDQLAHVCGLGESTQNSSAMSQFLQRNGHRAMTRPMLFRENLRHAIDKAVKDLQQAGQLGQDGLDAFIQGQVKANALMQEVD